jgi:hypothetical protein
MRGGSLFLLDINKDNDMLGDVADWFPLVGEYLVDSDNDEIGDAGDMIAATGECVSLKVP